MTLPPNRKKQAIITEKNKCKNLIKEYLLTIGKNDTKLYLYIDDFKNRSKCVMQADRVIGDGRIAIDGTEISQAMKLYFRLDKVKIKRGTRMFLVSFQVIKDKLVVKYVYYAS